MILDGWQQQVLDTEGNICLRSGRQVGKSTVISIKAAEFAVNNPGKVIMIVASVERQALLLFEKVLSYLHDYRKEFLKKGKDKPTKHKITLNNKSTIYCLPTGLSGYGIRGYTVDLLIADEAAFIPEEVWTAVTPMLAVTGGKIILLSTPFGRGGFFYRCFQDNSFTTFHISSEDCPRKDVDFLRKERERMTKAQYAQEYLGEFVDELRRFFPDSLIYSCMISLGETLPSAEEVLANPLVPLGDNFLGVDVARMGEDETVLYSVCRIKRDELVEIELEISEKNLLPDIVRRIKHADSRFNYKKIYIDDGGLGSGVFDPLMEDEQTKRKTISINNAARSLDVDEKRRKKLMKEDLYTNLLRLMEQGKVKLKKNTDTILSLKSIQYEYDEKKQLRIFGNYTHITEALIRAAWCMKDKTLNIWIC